MNLVQHKIITRLDLHWSQIVMLQGHHLAYWGHFFQGVASHDHLPDGVIPEKVQTAARPADQVTTYLDFWRGRYWEDAGGQREDKYLFPAEAIEPVLQLSTLIRFHIWESASKGWSMVLEYADASGHWSYTRAMDGVSSGWHEVPPDLP